MGNNVTILYKWNNGGPILKEKIYYACSAIKKEINLKLETENEIKLCSKRVTPCKDLSCEIKSRDRKKFCLIQIHVTKKNYL